MNAEQSILKHIGLDGVLKGYGIYDNVITAMEDYAQERVKNCSIPNVVGQSEQLNCDHPPDRLLYKGDPKRFRCSKCGKEIAF